MEQRNDVRFLSWTELKSIDTLPVGVGQRWFVFTVRHDDNSKLNIKDAVLMGCCIGAHQSSTNG
jgi:hypothetical protein